MKVAAAPPAWMVKPLIWLPTLMSPPSAATMLAPARARTILKTHSWKARRVRHEQGGDEDRHKQERARDREPTSGRGDERGGFLACRLRQVFPHRVSPHKEQLLCQDVLLRRQRGQPFFNKMKAFAFRDSEQLGLHFGHLRLKLY